MFYIFSFSNSFSFLIMRTSESHSRLLFLISENPE